MQPRVPSDRAHAPGAASVPNQGAGAVDTQCAALVGDVAACEPTTAEVQHLQRQLQHFSRAAQQINAHLEAPAILRQLVTAALDLTGAEGGTAGLVLEGQMVFTEYHQEDRWLPVDYRFAPGQGVPGRVMENRAPYLCADAEHDPHVSPEIQQSLAFHTLANVPILTRTGELLGCFEVHNRAGCHPFTAQDLVLLQGLAASAAVALENAWLFEAAQRELRGRQQAEQAVRESESRLRSIIEQAPFGAHSYEIQAGDRLVLTAANQSADRILGIDHAPLIGRTIEEAFPALLGTTIPDAYRRLATTEGSLDDEQVVYEEGHIRGAFAIQAFHTGAQRMTVFFRDITERKRAEQEKEKLQAQLTQAQKMESVGRLAGGVAHDFNNMLQAILGNVCLAMDDLPPDSPVRESLEEIEKSARRSADLTRQLLAFARKQTIAPRPLELNNTVEGMLRMLGRLIGEDIDLAWMPGTGVGLVMMDPSQLDQILANLCVNARDAISGVGTITIETAKVSFDETYAGTHPECLPGNYAMLSVSDSGKGMDAETRSHLFEPFFTTKEPGKGTGLGLATVFGIVKQNHGVINVYSEPGQGTTFKVYLPRVEAGLAVAEPRPPGRSVRGTETLLVVEDEEQILNLGHRILEQHGYTVLTARTPAAAQVLVEQYQEPIHLLITDVVMPGMNGKELRERLRSVHPALKCLFMSGYTANVIAHHGVLEDSVQFLQKPFTIRSLVEKVRETLEQPPT
jgi:two-component system cell cycle sensor histidine kinase/response regulator CckA